MPKTKKEDPKTTSPKELPDMIHEFDVDVIGEITAKRYLGTFTCRIMNQKQSAQVSKYKSFLNGPNAENLDAATLILHHRIAYLRHSLLEPFPKFWLNSDLGYELFDGNVIGVIFGAVLQWEEAWMTKVWGKTAVDKLKNAD